MYLCRLGVGGNGGVGLGVNQVQDHILYLAFSVSADFNHTGYQHRVLLLLEIRKHLPAEHGIQFIGRSRKQDSGLALLFQYQARGHAVGIVQHQRPLGDCGHLPVVVRYVPVNVIPEEFFQMLPGMGILHQRHAECVGTYLFCQIILCGAQASCQYENVRA